MGLRCLPMSHKKNVRFLWVKCFATIGTLGIIVFANLKKNKLIHFQRITSAFVIWNDEEYIKLINPYKPYGLKIPLKPKGLSTLVIWTSLFLRGVGGIFHIFAHFNRTCCKQTVKTLIRRRIMWRQI